MFSKLACVHRTLKAGIHILRETALLPMLKLLLNLSCFIANHIFIAGMKHSTRPLLSCSCKSKPYSIFLLAGSRARLLLPFMVIKHIQLFPPLQLLPFFHYSFLLCLTPRKIFQVQLNNFRTHLQPFSCLPVHLQPHENI